MHSRHFARLLALGAFCSLVAASPPAQAIGVFLHGFSGAGSSGGATPGTQTMAEDFAGMIPGTTYHGSWRAQADAVAKIKAAKEANPDEPVVLVGHSYGGDSIDEIAESLNECGICVDVYIQIDTVGAFDDTTPSNVKCGYNIWSTSKDGVNGESEVEGSENIPVDDTTHTDIDDKDSEGTSSHEEYEGKNAYEIVECILDAKLKGKLLGPLPTGPTVVALQPGGALVAPAGPVQPVCVGASLAQLINTSSEDKWFAAFDYLDEKGYDLDAVEQFVDGYEGVLEAMEAAPCDLSTLKRGKIAIETMAEKLPRFAQKGTALLETTGEIHASPNPFNPQTSIAFTLENAQSVSLRILDLRGREVRRLHTGTLEAGPHVMSWNGTNETGQSVASGVYLAVLRTPEKVVSARITLVK